MVTALTKDKRIERTPTEVDHAGAIQGALKQINDHRNGIPEFMKNAAGAYHRQSTLGGFGLGKKDRPIVLMFRVPRRNTPGIIGCLDVVGMTTQDISMFKKWFDPTAAIRDDPSAQLWGGHGNGAKSYMLKMFDRSWFATSRDDRYTRMGWMGNNLEIGFQPSSSEANAVRIEDPLKMLETHLKAFFRSSISDLPPEVQMALANRRTWTLFVGSEPRHRWVTPRQLVSQVAHHPQALRTIEYCDVYSVVDGEAISGGNPLEMEKIPPLPGGEEPLKIDVPESLQDPGGELISSTGNGHFKPGLLVLNTSADIMNYSLRHRHIIRCESSTKGSIGLFQVNDLTQGAAGHIYGDLYLDSLEDYESNFRNKPEDSPLMRAVEEWLRRVVGDYASRFKELADDRNTDQARNEIQRFNGEVNEFLRDFLTEMDSEDVDGGPGTNLDVLTRQGPRSELPDREVARIESDYGDDYVTCGENITLYVRLKFFDVDDEVVRPSPVHWESSDTSVAIVQLGSVVTGSPGQCDVTAVGANGVRSRPIRIQVVPVDEIHIEHHDMPVELGSRFSPLYRVLSSGNDIQNVSLDWHSSDEVYVKVGSNIGTATATAAPGVAEIWASCRNTESNRVRVTTEGGQSTVPRPKYPRVLLSEIDDDPDTGAPRQIDPDEGTVVQSIADRRNNIFWINMRSPIAETFLLGKHGLTYQSREFMIYLSDRYAEVIFLDCINQEDSWDPGEIVSVMNERPTKFRQIVARRFGSWLSGDVRQLG